MGGFFNIKTADGNEFNLGALFLAPDLSDGGTVTYFGSDGAQQDCEVISMKVTRWPPTYTLKTEDGSTVEVKHSQFVLNPTPIPQEEPQPLEESVKEVETEDVKEEEIGGPAALDINPEEKKVYHKQASWLKRRGRHSSVESSTTSEITAANLRTASLFFLSLFVCFEHAYAV